MSHILSIEGNEIHIWQWYNIGHGELLPSFDVDVRKLLHVNRLLWKHQDHHYGLLNGHEKFCSFVSKTGPNFWNSTYMYFECISNFYFSSNLMHFFCWIDIAENFGSMLTNFLYFVLFTRQKLKRKGLISANFKIWTFLFFIQY